MNKPLILVVEDDRSVNNLITTILKTHDYRYLTALNGAEAVLEASSHNPDIVLLDLGHGRSGHHKKDPYLVQYAHHRHQRQE